MAMDLTNSTPASGATLMTNDAVYYSYAQRQVLAGIIGIVSILGILGNILVIMAVVLSRKLRHATNYFVLNLSAADLLSCLFLPMGVVALLNDAWPLPDGICVVTAVVFLTSLACSINCLAYIAMNRYILITKSADLYQRLYTTRRILLAIVMVWFVPFIVAVVPASTGFVKLGFDPQFSCCAWVVSESDPGYYILLFFSSCPLQFSVILWSYVNVFCHVRKHAKTVRYIDGTPAGPNINTCDQNHSNPPRVPKNLQKSKLQIKVTKNLFYVVCAFLICTAPLGISLILGENGLRLYPIGATLLCCNSCVNPFIYAAKHPPFRTVFKCIVFGRFSEIPERVRLW